MTCRHCGSTDADRAVEPIRGFWAECSACGFKYPNWNPGEREAFLREIGGWPETPTEAMTRLGWTVLGQRQAQEAM